MKTYSLILIAVSLFTLQACTQKVARDRSISKNEQNVLEQNPFDPASRMTGVEGEDANTPADMDDSPYPHTYKDGVADPEFVKHPCSKANYEVELEEALKAAVADTAKKTIIVRYAFSFGLPYDFIANIAYNRTILRKNDDGVTPVMVDPASAGWGGAAQKTYYTDHKQARTDYINGKRCYFNTIKVTNEYPGLYMPYKATKDSSGNDVADTGDNWVPGTPNLGAYTWELAGMYHGATYSCDNIGECTRRYTSPRLFKSMELIYEDYKKTLELWPDAHTNGGVALSDFIRQCPVEVQAQILPLYVADFRDHRLGEETGSIVNKTYASAYIRNYEYEVTMKKMLNLLSIFQNREKLEKIWGNDFPAGNCGRNEQYNASGCSLAGGTNAYNIPANWPAYEGVPQLIENILWGGFSGIVTSVVYTPIALDLPAGNTPEEYSALRHIRTSSLDWGTFFNLANVVSKDSVDANGKLLATVKDVHHRTAWLGGKLVKAEYDLGFEGSGTPKSVYYRRSSDGFLVVPEQEGTCSDGSPRYKVNRGQDLFGAYSNENGETIEHNNGFAKLMDYVNKSGTAFQKTCAVKPEVISGGASLTTEEIKRRYFGVWDTVAYDKIKVWVDANRNGKVECGEVKSLKDSRVAAINVCNIVYTKNQQGQLVQARDKWGNATHLRAAFLVADDTNLMSEQEAITRLASGQKSTEGEAEFRVAIDVLFQTKKEHYLDDLDEDKLYELKPATKATQN